MMGAAALVLLPSCNGSFDWVYDKAPADEEQLPDDQPSIVGRSYRGTFVVNATSYTQWLYIDLDRVTNGLTPGIDTVQIVKDDAGIWTSDESSASQDWCIGVHRYDVRTHDGSALMTDFMSIDELLAYGQLPEGTFTADVEDAQHITTDLSQMMSGYVGYETGHYNPIITWVDVDTSNPPPVYTPHYNVYIVRTSDGKYAALQLKDYMNASNVKGYLTIEYLYPLDFSNIVVDEVITADDYTPTRGSFTVDCTPYDVWNYVNLHPAYGTTPEYTGAVSTLVKDTVTGQWIEPQKPTTWDFAMHRYDVKTNGATVLATDLGSIEELLALGHLPEGEWVPDSLTYESITVDMSQMMSGTIGYAEDYKNPAINWVYYIIPPMPPEYHYVDKVFLMKFQDESVAALRLISYMNSKNVKGYMTVDWLYPVRF